MTLVKHKPTTAPRVIPEVPKVAADIKTHEIYDHRDTPLWSLDSFLTGSKWTVTWFRQRLGANDPPKKLDTSLSPAHQAYDRISNLDILVQSALTSSFRDKEQLMEVTGSAMFYSITPPTVDDYIVAQSNLGRLGLFRITNVNRRNHERESVFIAEYAMEQEIDSEDPLYKDLYRKTVNRYSFSRQRFIENRQAILLEDCEKKLEDMELEFRYMTEDYYNDFYSVYTGTLTLPGQSSRIVDPFILPFIISIVPFEAMPKLQRAHLVSTNNNPAYTRPNIWDVLLRRRPGDLSRCERKMAAYDPREIHSSYFARSGNYVAADLVVFPLIQDGTLHSVDRSDEITTNTYDLNTQPFAPESPKNPDPSAKVELFQRHEPIIPYFPVTFDKTYIFSDSFYEGNPQSVIEVMIMDYLRNEAINQDQLRLLVRNYRDMGRLEQFYYGPILFLLMRESRRSNYT